MTGTRDGDNLISASHLFARRKSLSSGCKQKITPDEPLEPTRLPRYALLPHSFELAAGLKYPCVGRWVVIGADPLLIEDELDEPEEELPEGSTISVEELLSNAAKKNPFAASMKRRRLSQIEEKYNRKVQEILESLKSRKDSVEDDERFTDPSNPYRVIDYSINQGMNAEVFKAMIDHPMMVEAIGDTFEDPQRVKKGLESGDFALLCDRSTREMYIAEYDDACDLVETEVELSGTSSPVGRFNEVMAPVAEMFGPEYVRKATADAFMRILRDEMDAFARRTGDEPLGEVVVITIKGRKGS